MFTLTSHVKIGEYTVKPTSVKWKTSVLNLVDTCTIQLSQVIYSKRDDKKHGTEVKEDLPENEFGKQKEAIPFKSGDLVEVHLGYNKRNELRFKGFIKNVSLSHPIEIECEGYACKLYETKVEKNYGKTSFKKILNEITAGTGIILSEDIIDYEIKNVQVGKKTGMEVIKWLQNNCATSVYFDMDKIYAGAYLYPKNKREDDKPDIVKLQLGWNTVESRSLQSKKEGNDDANQTTLVFTYKDKQGKTVKAPKKVPQNSTPKEVKIHTGVSSEYTIDLADNAEMFKTSATYRGEVTCFLEPFIKKGTLVEIIDNTYKERSGKYIVESVDGSFDSSGGRQKITLKFYKK